MSELTIDDLRLAVHCAHLKRDCAPKPVEQQTAVCLHVIRAGKPCVGPFLHDLGTSCGLWEADARAEVIPLPTSQRGRRRRRDGWDFRTAYGD